MPRNSAGLVPYRVDPSGRVLVFVAHMGGPLWAKRDVGGWSIAKGEFDPATEEPEAVARREFREEIGVECPPGAWLDLGRHRQPSGKVVQAYAVHAPGTLRFRESNEFEMEWPPHSGQRASFPEVDRAEWLPLAQARQKLVSGQRPILDRLEALLGGSGIDRADSARARPDPVDPAH